MDEDIKLINEIKKEYSTMDGLKEYVQAIENLLSRLKTAEREIEIYKKIEEEIKQKAHYCLEVPYEHCKKYKTSECGKCIIEWARKKVEDEL